MRDYQESVTTGQTHAHMHGQTDAGQSDSYVPLCFAGDTIKVADKTTKSWTLMSLEKVSLVEYACQIRSLHISCSSKAMAKVKVFRHVGQSPRPRLRGQNFLCQ